MKSHWHQNERLWKDLHDFLFPSVRMGSARAEVENVLKLAGVTSGSVLDLCCGVGRHSVEFAAAGLAVTGVDQTEFYLQKARALARTRKVNVSFHHASMIDFRQKNAFDLAVNLFTSFGYFEKTGDNLKVLKNIHASLKPGGKVVIDVMPRERLKRTFTATGMNELPDGRILFEHRRVKKDWAVLHNRWFVVSGNRVNRYEFDLTVFSAPELKRLMRQAGFSRIKLYGDFLGTPFGPESFRLVAVGVK